LETFLEKSYCKLWGHCRVYKTNSCLLPVWQLQSFLLCGRFSHIFTHRFLFSFRSHSLLLDFVICTRRISMLLAITVNGVSTLLSCSSPGADNTQRFFFLHPPNFDSYFAYWPKSATDLFQLWTLQKINFSSSDLKKKQICSLSTAELRLFRSMLCFFRSHSVTAKIICCRCCYLKSAQAFFFINIRIIVNVVLSRLEFAGCHSALSFPSITQSSSVYTYTGPAQANYDLWRQIEYPVSLLLLLLQAYHPLQRITWPCRPTGHASLHLCHMLTAVSK